MPLFLSSSLGLMQFTITSFFVFSSISIILFRLGLDTIHLIFWFGTKNVFFSHFILKGTPL